MIADSTPMHPVSSDDRGIKVALVALTFSTGLIDALSFIAFGHVFTANMTGNIVFLAFALAGVQGLSAARSAVSLLAFMVGAVCGGILNIRFSAWTQLGVLKLAFVIEAALLLLAAAIATLTGSAHNLCPSVTYSLIAITPLRWAYVML